MDSVSSTSEEGTAVVWGLSCLCELMGVMLLLSEYLTFFCML